MSLETKNLKAYAESLPMSIDWRTLQEHAIIQLIKHPGPLTNVLLERFTEFQGDVEGANIEESTELFVDITKTFRKNVEINREALESMVKAEHYLADPGFITSEFDSFIAQLTSLENSWKQIKKELKESVTNGGDEVLDPNWEFIKEKEKESAISLVLIAGRDQALYMPDSERMSSFETAKKSKKSITQRIVSKLGKIHLFTRTAIASVIGVGSVFAANASGINQQDPLIQNNKEESISMVEQIFQLRGSEDLSMIYSLAIPVIFGLQTYFIATHADKSLRAECAIRHLIAHLNQLCFEHPNFAEESTAILKEVKRKLSDEDSNDPLTIATYFKAKAKDVSTKDVNVDAVLQEIDLLESSINECLFDQTFISNFFLIEMMVVIAGILTLGNVTAPAIIGILMHLLNKSVKDVRNPRRSAQLKSAEEAIEEALDAFPSIVLAKNLVKRAVRKALGLKPIDIT